MSVNLEDFFYDLGIVSGNTNATNQYEFYNGIIWGDDNITSNQYEFYKKLQTTRYDFFKQYGGEFKFYEIIGDYGIYDFYTFYQYSPIYLDTLSDKVWLLVCGYWEDNNVWKNDGVWEDSIIC